MSGRVAGLGDRELVVFTFEGHEVHAWQGDTIAMALWAQDQISVRNSSSAGQPRGVLCNMGICYDCLVVVDGATVRSCTTVVQPGMQVGRGGKPESPSSTSESRGSDAPDSDSPGSDSPGSDSPGSESAGGRS